MKLLSIAGSSLIYLLVFGLGGGIASFFFDVMDLSPSGPITNAFYYVLWCVLGILCGLLSYQSGVTIAARAGKSPWIVLIVETVVLLAAFLPSLFLSGNTSLTLTYLISILASAIFGHFSAAPKIVR